MSIKRTFTGKTTPSIQMSHQYEDNTCIGADYWVTLTTKVTEGRDAGRLVITRMNSDHARELAAKLLKLADDNDEKNGELRQ